MVNVGLSEQVGYEATGGWCGLDSHQWERHV